MCASWTSVGGWVCRRRFPYSETNIGEFDHTASSPFSWFIDGLFWGPADPGPGKLQKHTRICRQYPKCYLWNQLRLFFILLLLKFWKFFSQCVTFLKYLNLLNFSYFCNCWLVSQSSLIQQFPKLIARSFQKYIFRVPP